MMTVAQKCSGAMKIQKYDGLTYGSTNGLTWVGARDTCVTEKVTFSCHQLMWSGKLVRENVFTVVVICL